VLANPHGMPWERWAGQAYEDYAAGGVPTPTPETRWKEWARGFLVADTVFSTSGAPAPDSFSDWREWAARMVHFS